MKRRQRKGAFEVGIEIANRLPWWLCLVCAVVSYLLFHTVAGIQLPAAKDIQGLGSRAGLQIFQMSGMVLQYLVPLVFVFGAISSVLVQRKRDRLISDVQWRGDAGAFLDLSWADFERLVAESFRRRGYAVAENAGPGPDGGVDLTMTKGREKFLVQCKRWKATLVGVEVVRELYGVMAARGATGGFVVSSGQFSPDAKAFAEGRNIELVDSKGLLAQINPEFAAASISLPAAPTCPVCAGPMVRRTARRGKTAGQSFWGCASYPHCRGTK